MRGAIRLTGMIDKAGDAAVFRAINVPFFIEFKLVDIGRFSFTLFFLAEEFSSIRFRVRNFFASIFDDLRAGRNPEACINSTSMDFRVSNLQAGVLIFFGSSGFHERYLKSED